MAAADVSGASASAPASTVPTVKLRPSVRAVGQVMAALKNSKSLTGPTMTEIVKFISVALAKPATKRQICTALKRGVDFGILRRKRGHYLISSPEENLAELPKFAPKKILKKARHPAKVAKRKRNGNPVRPRRQVRRVIEQVPMFVIPEMPYELKDMYRSRNSAFSSVTTLADLEKKDTDFE